jgi:hypothetical protein
MITPVLHLLRLLPFLCGGLSFAKTSAGGKSLIYRR